MPAENIKLASQQLSANNSKRFIPKPYRNIAKAMEKQFVEHMLEQMGKTVPGQEKKDTATKYYESLLKSERANLMAQNNGGIGIQDMILNKIYPKRIAPQKSINAYLKRNSQNSKDELLANNINDTVNNFRQLNTSLTSKEDTHE